MSVTKLGGKNVLDSIAYVPAGVPTHTTDTAFSVNDVSAAGAGSTKATHIAFGNNIWIMFGNRGMHAWSHDGDNWYSGRGPLAVSQRVAIPEYVTHAIYAGGQWVATTNKGNIYTGTDQHTWTLRTSPFGGTAISKIAYGNGYYVAVGAAGKWAYSTDGITWTLGATTVFTTSNIWGCWYHTPSTRWVLVGAGGLIATHDTNPTGTQTSRTNGFAGSIIYDVTGSSTTLVACGATGKNAYSTDGITWTQNTAVASGNLCRIGYNATSAYFIMAQNGAIDQYWSNNNGVAWTTVNIHASFTTIPFNTTSVPFGFNGTSRVATVQSNTASPYYQNYFTTTSTSYLTTSSTPVVNMGAISKSTTGSAYVSRSSSTRGGQQMIATKDGKTLAVLGAQSSGGGTTTAGYWKFLESNDGGLTWYCAKIKPDMVGSGIGSGVPTGTTSIGTPTFIKVINNIWFMGDNLGNLHTSYDGEVWCKEVTLASECGGIEYGNGYYHVYSSTPSGSTTVYTFRTNGSPIRFAQGNTGLTTTTFTANNLTIGSAAVIALKYANEAWWLLTSAGTMYKSTTDLSVIYSVSAANIPNTVKSFDVSNGMFALVGNPSVGTNTWIVCLSTDGYSWLRPTLGDDGTGVAKGIAVNMNPQMLQVIDGMPVIASDSLMSATTGLTTTIVKHKISTTLGDGMIFSNLTAGAGAAPVSTYTKIGNNFWAITQADNIVNEFGGISSGVYIGEVRATAVARG